MGYGRVTKTKKEPNRKNRSQVECENICLSGYCLDVPNRYSLERRQMILEQAPGEQKYVVRKRQQKTYGERRKCSGLV